MKGGGDNEVQQILIVKLEEKRPLGRPRLILEGNIKRYFREIGRV
jgi:hypothetical protein